jgi:tyrosine-specific transport protein
MLVAGTAIGGGVLMLPVLVSRTGIGWGLLANGLTAGMMSVTAWFMALDYLRNSGENSSCFGIYGKSPWVRRAILSIYVFLYVALLVAYSTGISNVIAHLVTDETSKKWFWMGIVWLILGGIVAAGPKWLQLHNSLLMGLLLFLCGRLLFPCFRHLRWENFSYSDGHYFGSLFPVFICSYGFHVVIPTVCRSLNGNRGSIGLAIGCGSLLVLTVYTLFLVGSLGVLSREVLGKAFERNLPVTLPLGERLGQNGVFYGTAISLFAMATSFLGVGESFARFLSDNRFLPSVAWGRRLVLMIPLVGGLKIGALLLKSLSGAGIICGILFGILPTLSWFRRQSHWIYRWAGLVLIFGFAAVVGMAWKF